MTAQQTASPAELLFAECAHDLEIDRGNLLLSDITVTVEMNALLQAAKCIAHRNVDREHRVVAALCQYFNVA